MSRLKRESEGKRDPVVDCLVGLALGWPGVTQNSALERYMNGLLSNHYVLSGSFQLKVTWDRSTY